METLHRLNTHAAVKRKVFTKKMFGIGISYRNIPETNSSRKKWVVYKVLIDN